MPRGLEVIGRDPAALAGQWRLSGQSGRGNFAGYATPTRLTISESGNEVTVAADTGTENQMVTSTYRLDGVETAVPGPLGWDTRAKAARKDGALVVSVTRTIDGPSAVASRTGSFCQTRGARLIKPP